ncbi:hypothetical protein AB0E01_44635 [Nocardia vinacea]|uniref:hypothetical protein n=1 Tax=Nocardia vinacea TaxID=96468 RepID=UPI00341149B1
MDRDTVHQCSWTYDAEGNRCWIADRRASEVFAAAETLADAAAATGTVWSSMVGHWFKSQLKRRPDAMKTTTALTDVNGG